MIAFNKQQLIFSKL